MARIAIIRMFYGMSLASTQLSGELLAHGHEPLNIYFKTQEWVHEDDADNPIYDISEVPMRGVLINKEGDNTFQSAIWMKTSQTELDNLKKTLANFKPDAIGVSGLTVGMKLAKEVTEFLKKEFDVPILWGGTGPTIEPEKSIESADLLCVGEGEEVIIEIADRLDKKQDLSGIHGTWYKLPDGTVQKNPKRPVSDLDAIARPSWETYHQVFINKDELITNFKPEEKSFDKSYQMMTQRGCPFSCSFCVESFYQKEFGKKGSLRRMKPQKAIDELLYAKKVLKYRRVTFMDDVFTVNPRWLDEFLPMYKEQIGLPFFAYTYPSTHTKATLEKLKDAGCHAITMGVQSGSERILVDVYNRPTHINRVIEAANEIVESGIPAATFDLIPQTSFDTEQDLIDTFELLLQIPKELDTTFYAELAYFPNYPIHENLADNDLIAKATTLTKDDYSFYFKLYNLTRTEMPVEEIRAIANDPKYRKNHNLLNPYLNDDSVFKPNYGPLIGLGIKRRKAKEKALEAERLLAEANEAPSEAEAKTTENTIQQSLTNDKKVEFYIPPNSITS